MQVRSRSKRVSNASPHGAGPRAGAGARSVVVLLVALAAAALAGLWWTIDRDASAPRPTEPLRARSPQSAPQAAPPLAEVSTEERAGDELAPDDIPADQAPIRRDDGEARFDGRGSIRGEVTTPAGVELPAAFSVVVAPAAHLVGRERAVTRRIDVLDGRRSFHFDDLPLGGYDVHAEARGMNGRKRSVLLVKHSPDQRVDVSLTPAGVLDGRVQDERGQPVEGITVTLTSDEGIRMGAVTDALGFYAFDEVLDGEYTLAVGAPEGPLVPPKSLSFQSPRMTLSIDGVPLTSDVLVVTLDARGEPLPSVRVRGFGVNGGSVDTVTDHTGSAHVRFLPPGRLRLEASTEDGRRARGTLEVEPDRDGRIELRLR
jgi:hypothetical protein